MQVQLCPHVETTELRAHTAPPRSARTPKDLLVSMNMELCLESFALKSTLDMDLTVCSGCR